MPLWSTAISLHLKSFTALPYHVYLKNIFLYKRCFTGYHPAKLLQAVRIGKITAAKPKRKRCPVRTSIYT